MAASITELNHTTLLELVIDRGAQQPTATSLTNITRWSQFEYVYKLSVWLGVTVREQSFCGKGTFISVENLKKLWLSPQQSTNSALITPIIPTTTNPTPLPQQNTPRTPNIKISHKKAPPPPSFDNQAFLCRYCALLILRECNIDMHEAKCKVQHDEKIQEKKKFMEQLTQAQMRTTGTATPAINFSQHSIPLIDIGSSRYVKLIECCVKLI